MTTSFNINRRIFIETTGQGSAIGKTLLADLIYISSRHAGLPTTMCRIEAKRESRSRRNEEIHINTKNFALTSQTIGGVAGVLRQMLSRVWKLQTDPGVVVVDWGAGLLAQRKLAYSQTAFNYHLETNGIEGFSFLLTTRDIDRMRDALLTAKKNAKLLASARTILVLNEVEGRFDFPLGSESQKVFEELKSIVSEDDCLFVPKDEAMALETLQTMSRPLEELVRMDPDDVASELGLEPFIAIVCLTSLGAFMSKMDAELSRLLSFRMESGSPSHADKKTRIAEEPNPATA